jgi:type VI protein secretion system component VasK
MLLGIICVALMVIGPLFGIKQYRASRPRFMRIALITALAIGVISINGACQRRTYKSVTGRSIRTGPVVRASQEEAVNSVTN